MFTRKRVAPVRGSYSPGTPTPAVATSGHVAIAARPGVRSLGPTVDSLLPLVKQLRGLVQPRLEPEVMFGFARARPGGMAMCGSVASSLHRPRRR